MGQIISFIGALWSRRCNVQQLINDTTFQPPCPCHYLIGNIAGKCYGRVFVGEKSISIPDNVEVLFLPVDDNRTICIFHIHSSSERAAIIYSHGNAADCGSMLPRCMQMSERLDLDIVLYDYEGYGYSVGQPSGDSIRTDIEIVYHYLLKQFDSRKIFLYGESIGSVPTLHLAEQVSKARTSYRAKHRGSSNPKAIIPEPELSQTDYEFSDCSVELDEELDSIGWTDKPPSVADGNQSSLSHTLSAYSTSSPKSFRQPKRRQPENTNEIGGVVLHSAVLSGCRIVFNNDFLRGCDPFDNTESASNVGCPVFHIHGTKDMIVPFSSGVKLYEYTGSVFDPWWVANGKHGDIVVNHEKEYYKKLSYFVSFCLERF